MTLKKPKPQPTGYVISDPQDGTIIIGKDPDSDRSRQIELGAQSLGCIRLFEDGGFDIRSNTSSQRKDNILSQSKEGFAIKVDGAGFNIDCTGELTINARSIVLRSTGSDTGGITIDSGNHIKLDASDNIKIEGSNVAVAARNKMLVASKGLLNIRGVGGVLISEPKQKLIPTSISDVIETAFKFILPEYF